MDRNEVVPEKDNMSLPEEQLLIVSLNIKECILENIIKLSEIREKKSESPLVSNQEVLDEMIQNLENLIKNIEKKQQLSLKS